MTTFEERLIELRKTKNVTQEDVAKFLGVTRPAYTAYEAGRRQPDYKILQKLALYFGVTTDYLLGHSDTLNSNNPNEKIKAAINNDPELTEFWKELSQREDLQLMFKQTRDLSPQSIKKVIKIIKAIEDEETDE